MSEIIEWVLELEIADGKLEALEALMQEMSDATQSDEPGALIYEWYVDAGATTCHIIERYADNDAVMTHLTNFGQKFAERFTAILKPTAITVYGPASVQVMAALGAFAPLHFKRFGGFHR